MSPRENPSLSTPPPGSTRTLTATLPDQEPSIEKSTQAGEPPDGGYGWICVACIFFINMHTWGVNSSYGVFLAFYLAHNYFPHASPIKFAFVGGLSISQALLIAPLATYITRRYGTRSTLMTGVVLETVALVGASFTHQIWQLFLSQGLCFGFGMGFLFVGSVGIVPQWFSAKRSLANGIATAGSGLGGMMYSLAANAMIESLGIQWTFRILGILCCATNLVCTVLVKDRNTAIGAKHVAFDYALFKRGEFWLLLGWGFFSMMGYVVLLFSLPNYAVSLGLSARKGSEIGALLNLGQGIGRPIVGILSDRAGRINLAGLCTFVAGFLSLVMWTFAKSYGIVIFFAILVGTVAGTFWTAIAPVGAETVGLVELPSALSIMWVFLVVPTTFSEPIALELRQRTGNIYLNAQLYTGFMYIAAALCMLFLRTWKIRQVQTSAAEGKQSSKASRESANDAERAQRTRFSSILKRKRMMNWERV